ncbi:unnamed protein product [Rhodiola kirilowii]
MPLSDFYLLAKGKSKSGQQSAASCSAEPSSLSGSDFVELVWENGQVVMKGQPDGAKKHLDNNNSLVDLPRSERFKDKELAKGENSEMGRLGMMDSLMNDFHISGPSELDEHDDMVPWLSYHMNDDEPVQRYYNSDLLTEVSGVTAAEFSNHSTSVIPGERVSLQNPADFEQRNLSSSTRPRMSQLGQMSSLQSKCSFPSFRSKVSDANSNYLNNTTTQNLPCNDSAQKCYLSSVYPSKKVQTQDPGQRLPNSSIMNFPHFAAMVKPSFDAVSAKANPEVSITRKVDDKDKGSIPIAGNQANPSQVPSTSGQHRERGFNSQPVASSSVDGSKFPMSKPIEISHQAGHSGNVGVQDSRKIDVSTRQAIVPNGNRSAGDAKKTTEPVVASSVCSGNSVDRASNDPTYGLKRKHNGSEDSEYPSEDVEEESVGIKKAVYNRVGSGSKRSRAAEVHNLSERRRRDRINEKMRALQELIPNCNKVDKASMLDEAIEYLKTLQLQVQLQMMSMGSGLCMPPMMLPHAAHMPRFSPMGFGMGVGMGYGSGMLEMNGNSFSCPPVQMPCVPGTQFPAASPNITMFGFQGQGVPMSMPHAPEIAFPFPAGPPIRPVVDLNTTTTSSARPSENCNSVQTSQPKDSPECYPGRADHISGGK